MKKLIFIFGIACCIFAAVNIGDAGYEIAVAALGFLLMAAAVFLDCAQKVRAVQGQHQGSLGLGGKLGIVALLLITLFVLSVALANILEYNFFLFFLGVATFFGSLAARVSLTKQ